MELRRNVFISIVLHATICAAALALAGRHVAVHSPERFISVTLFEHSAGRKNTSAETAREKKALTPKHWKRFPGLRDITTPEVPVMQETKDKESPVRLKPENIPVQDNTGSRESPLPSDSVGTADAHHDAEVQGTSEGDAQITNPGEAGTGATTGRLKNKGPAGDVDRVSAIRAAIERAKSYPPLARKRGIGGTVTAEFTISSTGQPVHIKIIRSSGYEILDNAARRTLLRAAPFPSVDGTLQVPITFRIER